MKSGVEADDLKAFSTGVSKNDDVAIRIYNERALRTSSQASSADREFVKSLRMLVDTSHGFVGQHSGIQEKGSLHLSIVALNEVDEQPELDESQGDKNEGRNRSPSPPTLRVNSKSPRGVLNPVVNPKGKGKATPRANSKGKGKATARANPTRKARATRKADPKVDNPLRRTRRIIKGSSDQEPPSSSDTRRQKKVTEEDEGYTDSRPEPSDAEDEGNEETGSKEMGRPTPSSPLTSMYWAGFLKDMEPKKFKKYGSKEDWVADVIKNVEEYAAKL